MRDHALKHDVKHIAMPRIGCGLDGLVWPKVQTVLEDVFAKESIEISVYSI